MCVCTWKGATVPLEDYIRVSSEGKACHDPALSRDTWVVRVSMCITFLTRLQWHNSPYYPPLDPFSCARQSRIHYSTVAYEANGHNAALIRLESRFAVQAFIQHPCSIRSKIGLKTVYLNLPFTLMGQGKKLTRPDGTFIRNIWSDIVQISQTIINFSFFFFSKYFDRNDLSILTLRAITSLTRGTIFCQFQFSDSVFTTRRSR